MRISDHILPEADFATAEAIKRHDIGVGDEIIIVGLFTRFHGQTKHVPIVRTGNIAMMSEEKIPTEEGEIEAYLAEGRSIGGLSGSPVFVRHTVKMGGLASADGEEQFLAGLGRAHLLMHGHWDLPVGGEAEHAEAVNMGISIVVPAKKSSRFSIIRN